MNCSGLKSGSGLAKGRGIWNWTASGFVVGLVLGSALSSFGQDVPRSESQPGASPAPASAESRAASAAQFPGFRFAGGKKSLYRIEYTSVSNADLRLLFQDQNVGSTGQQETQSSALTYSLAAGLQSEVELTTVTAGRERVEILCRFHRPMIHLVVNGQPQTEQANDVASELSRGFLVELDSRGKIAGVYLQPKASKFLQDFVRTLLAIAQFVFPAEPPADGHSWTVREQDRSGVYLAHYEIVSNSLPEHPDWIALRKSKLRYFPEPPNSSPPVPGRKDVSRKVAPRMNLVARFDLGGGELVSLAGTEIQDTSIQDKMVAHSESEIRLNRSSSGMTPDDELHRAEAVAASLRSSSSPLPLFARRSQADVEASVQRSELGSLSVKDLLPMLKALRNEAPDSDKQQAAETPAYLKVKALIYVHPEACKDLEPILATADPSSPAFRIVARAMGAVAHPQAQTSLIHVIQARPEDAAALPNLISTLGSVPQPTIAAERELQRVAANAPDPNISGTAILALGSMAKALKVKNPERSAAIVNYLLHQAVNAQSDEKTQHLLQALGNTGSDRAMPLLSRYASSSSPVLRAAAVDGLRSIQQPQAGTLLLHTLVSDADPHVRLEAAFALGFRGPGKLSFETQRKALTGESDEKVRAALLANLAKMHTQFPEARAVVEEAAAKDPSELVRKAAAALLHQMSTVTPN